MEFQPVSEWASPSFIIHKTDKTVRMISDFWEVNRRLAGKPFPIPKISTVLQELEGFTFDTTLDLNMGYYTIRLDPDASTICTMIFPGESIISLYCRFTKHLSGKNVGTNGSP